MNEMDTEQEQTKLSLEQQVATWSSERAEIAALAATAEGVTIAGHANGPKAGREAVHNTLMPIWRRRCAIDNREKELLEIPKQLSEQIKRTASELSAPLLAAEDRLRKDRDAYDAEQERIKAEAKETELLRVQARVEAMVSAGVTPDIQKATHLTDEQFAALIEECKAEKAKRLRAVEVAQELTNLGDDCTDAESYALTIDQAEYRLSVARKAFADREETARIKRDEEAQRLHDQIAQEENDRQAAQRAQQDRFDQAVERCRILALLGEYEQPDNISDISESAFQEKVDTATIVKQKRDAETTRQLLAEQEHQEAKRQAQERADEQERQESAARERERQEVLRPQREAVAEWSQAALDTMPSTPDIDDPDILRAMRDHVERARLALLDLRNRMNQEPAND